MTHAPSTPPAYTDRTLPAPWAACEVCGGPAHALHPGPDAVLITNATPDGDALLYYTGIHGVTQPGQREAYRVPPHLLAQVRAALGYFTGGPQ